MDPEASGFRGDNPLVSDPGATPWGPCRLAAVEAELFALRRRPADLRAAFDAAVDTATAGRVTPRMRRIGEVLADAVMRHPNDLAYHSLHHFVETVLVFGCLCRIALRQGRLDPGEAALGVIAMVGHDYKHDGSPPDGGTLEALAAAESLAILADEGLGDAEAGILEAVIIGTEPGRVRENADRAAGDLPAGPYGRGVDLMRSLANEADVFASFLPDMGPRQSQLLAEEWRAGGHARADAVMGFANRLAFLRVYDRLSPMSLHMGVGELRARQFSAFTCGGGLLEIGGTPDEGAAALDTLPPDDARQRFTACLREMR